MIEHRTVRLGDFNRDGRIDLLAASVGFSSTQAATQFEPAVKGASDVWFENPARPSEQPWPKPVIDNHSRGPIPGPRVDLDHDRDLDVLMAFGMRPEHVLQDHHAIAWYENRGGAQDSTAWRRHVLANLPSAFETFAANLDGDGDLDLAVTAWSLGDRVVGLENPGRMAAPWPPLSTQAAGL